jgi:hypothetical protein
MGRYWPRIVARPEIRVPTYRPTCDVCDRTGSVPRDSAIAEKAMRSKLKPGSDA